MPTCKLAAAVLCLIPPLGWANVSIRNGNFFIGYTDVIYSGGFEPKIERVYNSKSPFKGPFGWGWGTELDKYMEVLGDGTILVHEYGGGAESLFLAAHPSAEVFERSLRDLIQAKKSATPFKNSSEEEAYQKRLHDDSDFRADEWRELVRMKLLPTHTPEVGTVLVSYHFGHQTMRRIRDGYTLVYDDGRYQYFDLSGRLTRIFDKNNNYEDLGYDDTGKLRTIRDNYGRTLTIAFNGQGAIESVTDNRQRKSDYRYDDKANLIYAKDVDGNIYEYRYDDRHNMTAIVYSDGTTQEIDYFARDKHENVHRVKDRDGTLTEYTYDQTKGETSQFSVEVSVKDAKGQVLSIKKYEYVIAKTPQGEEWTQKLATTVDGERTETTYSDLGLPIVIRRGQTETRFAYDREGKLIRKETSDEVTEMEYHPQVHKITLVRKYPPGHPENAAWSRFRYDDAGNLIFAEDSEKTQVELLYDITGRINEMRSGTTKIRFKYNSNSKPVAIEAVGVGTIQVTYAANGEIEKVDSPTGKAVALQVTSAFQKLLDVIRPAGVNLSF